MDELKNTFSFELPGEVFVELCDDDLDVFGLDEKEDGELLARAAVYGLEPLEVE